MRNAFAQAVVSLAQRDPHLVLLSGDIGNRLFDDFKTQFPDRFYNCGIAEANMLSLAAGLALCGLRPIAYTITPFVTTRCLEQIRVDLSYHQTNVIIAGVGSGLCYAELGATHQACEDIAFLRALPGMTVICPADGTELRLSMAAALNHTGPVYLRLGKKGEPDVHTPPPEASPEFHIGKAIVIRPGTAACLLATGNVVHLALQAADLLAQEGIAVQVVSMHTVKPLDTVLLQESFRRFPLVVTLEEHSLIGGLGAAVAEWKVDQTQNGDAARLLRLGAPDAYAHEAGHHENARRAIGLTPQAVAQRIQTFIPNFRPLTLAP